MWMPTERLSGWVPPDLFDGFTGLAVFASACASVWPDSRFRDGSEVLVHETTEELRGLCESIEMYEDIPDAQVYLGESGGLASILTGIALISRYTQVEEMDAIRTRLLAFLERTSYSNHSPTGRT